MSKKKAPVKAEHPRHILHLNYLPLTKVFDLKAFRWGNYEIHAVNAHDLGRLVEQKASRHEAFYNKEIVTISRRYTAAVNDPKATTDTLKCLRLEVNQQINKIRRWTGLLDTDTPNAATVLQMAAGGRQKRINDRYGDLIQSLTDCLRIIESRLDLPVKVIKKEDPSPNRLQDCFSTPEDFEKAIKLLQDVTPCIVNRDMQFTRAQGGKAAIAEWLRFLKDTGKYGFVPPNRPLIIQLLNEAFTGLEMGSNGRTLDNHSKYYKQKFRMQA